MRTKHTIAIGAIILMCVFLLLLLFSTKEAQYSMAPGESLYEFAVRVGCSVPSSLKEFVEAEISGIASCNLIIGSRDGMSTLFVYIHLNDKDYDPHINYEFLKEGISLNWSAKEKPVALHLVSLHGRAQIMYEYFGPF